MGGDKRRAAAVSGDPGFEEWVARQLRRLHDEVLDEELPADLLRLIDRLTSAAASPGKRTATSGGKPGERAAKSGDGAANPARRRGRRGSG